MIIWAGWGIIGLVPIGIALAGGSALAGATGWSVSLVMGLGMILAGVANYFLGIYFNVTKPAADLANRMDQRSAQLHAMADAGTFYRGPGYPMPTSLAEAHQQADQLAAEEYQGLKGKVANRHTLMFVPLQWVGVLGGLVGVVMAIASFFL
jgi:membrane protein YqaA with SNARE-associated domain